MKFEGRNDRCYRGKVYLYTREVNPSTDCYFHQKNAQHGDLGFWNAIGRGKRHIDGVKEICEIRHFPEAS